MNIQNIEMNGIYLKQYKGKLIAVNAYFKKGKRAQINNLIFHLKILVQEEQTKPKVGRRKKIIKMRVEI